MSLPKVFFTLGLLCAGHAFSAGFFLEVTGVSRGQFKGENAAGQIPWQELIRFTP